MHLTDKDKHWLSKKGWKKIFQANGHSKQTGIATLIFHKADFKPKLEETKKVTSY
jgi:hypothetical protein